MSRSRETREEQKGKKSRDKGVRCSGKIGKSSIFQGPVEWEEMVRDKARAIRRGRQCEVLLSMIKTSTLS